MPSTQGLILANKYRNDLAGDKEVLGFSGNTVQMVPESRSNAVTWNLELAVPMITTRPIVGDRKVLLLHTQYSDKPETGFDPVKQAFFGEPRDNYLFVNAVTFSSGDHLEFTGDAITDLDLGPKPPGCPSTELRNKARDLARDKGFDRNLRLCCRRDSFYFVFLGRPCCDAGLWAMGNGVGW
ncbi:Ricin B lectin [Pseudomonas cannabina]|uniref:Ricin B lectin n=1 Tax=Pseudomonas cannabina TaxID=86840 RepID=A0A3M3M0P3_PSECA|nr:Ricin B lectin [Pseudomonas cannabina]